MNSKEIKKIFLDAFWGNKWVVVHCNNGYSFSGRVKTLEWVRKYWEVKPQLCVILSEKHNGTYPRFTLESHGIKNIELP